MFTIVFLFLRTPFEDRSGFVFIVTENRFYAHETGEPRLAISDAISQSLWICAIPGSSRYFFAMTLGISDRHIEQTWRPTVHRCFGLVFWRDMSCHTSGGRDGIRFWRSWSTTSPLSSPGVAGPHHTSSLTVHSNHMIISADQA